MKNPEHLSRRGLLRLLAALPALIFARPLVARSSMMLEATPELPDPDEPTPEMTAGPFFKPNSPERTSLVEKGMKGGVLVVEGRVMGTDSKPIPKALLDFWHCDADGDYDNAGYRLRGHQFADADGRYRLETVFPGLYPGRTRHIHVRVQRPNGRILTTQLFFPNEQGNRRDGIFREQCVVKMAAGEKGNKGSFDFVLRTV